MRLGPHSLGILAALVLGALTPACGGSRRTDGSAPAREPRRSGLITEAEIARRDWSDVYEVVLTLRGNWLHDRGPDTISGRPAEIQVHLNTFRLGGVGALRGMSAVNVRAIEWVPPNEAAGRWGLGYNHGAIVVWTQDR